MQSQPIQLLVVFDPSTRAVQVSGPIHDKALCYGMLECAKDAIRDHVADLTEGQRPPSSGLVIAQGSL